MKKLISTVILGVISLTLFAQTQEIEVTPMGEKGWTTKRIVKNLVVQGVIIKEIKTNVTSKSHAMGVFQDNERRMGVRRGMVLSTGVVDNISGKNTSTGYTSWNVNKKAGLASSDSGAAVQGMIPVSEGDSDLSAEIQGLKTFDARVIEIRFIPTADTFYYRYVFASEEYDEYVCSPFNDVFAFYLIEEDGKKWNTALIPLKNEPVSINTVNGGNPMYPNCTGANSYLYQRYNGTQGLIFDGFTKVLDIRCKVIPGKEYVIKIAIADASDGVLDSAVLLENGSIFSYSRSVEMKFDNNSAAATDTSTFRKILELAKTNLGGTILLIGHASKLGSFSDNLELSKQRVISVRDLLISNGISANRIKENYKGEWMPRYDNDGDNRRVEAFFLGD